MRCTAVNRTVIPATQRFFSLAPPPSCQGVAGMAAADVHADDAGNCPAFQIQSMTCFNALADDDNDTSDNRRPRTPFRSNDDKTSPGIRSCTRVRGWFAYSSAAGGIRWLWLTSAQGAAIGR